MRAGASTSSTTGATEPGKNTCAWSTSTAARGMAIGWDLSPQQSVQIFTSADGLTAGGTTLLPAELRKKQIPPHWSIYFHVDDVDAAVARATARGAQMPMAALDIPTVGRVAFIIDPQGAGVGLRTPE